MLHLDRNPDAPFEYKLWSEDLDAHVNRHHTSIYDRATDTLLIDAVTFGAPNLGNNFGFLEGRGKKTCLSEQRHVIRQLPENLQNRPDIVDPDKLYHRSQLDSIIIRPESDPLY